MIVIRPKIVDCLKVFYCERNVQPQSVKCQNHTNTNLKRHNVIQK